MRSGPPTRPLILFAPLLLVGGGVNVAVAWVLVGAPDSWTPGGSSEITEFDWNLTLPDGEEMADDRDPFATWMAEYRAERQRITTWLRAVGARLGEPTEHPTPYLGSMTEGFGWTRTVALWHDTDGRQRLDAGWPARSLTAHAVMTPEGGSAWASPSFEPPRRLLPSGEWFAGSRDRLPLTPPPAGFALNTLFYTAILALPLSFFPIRRRLRARRGRCPKCGYDLAGLGGADPAAPCPECGATR